MKGSQPEGVVSGLHRELLQSGGPDQGRPGREISTSGGGGAAGGRPGAFGNDYVVVEAAAAEEGRVADIPRDRSGPGRPGPRLLLPEDDFAVVIEAAPEDPRRDGVPPETPRDRSGPLEAGFRLPLPEAEAEADFVVVEAAAAGKGRQEEASAFLFDIPRDWSGPHRPGFKLPLPPPAAAVKAAAAVEAVPGADGQAGFRGPQPASDYVVVEAAHGNAYNRDRVSEIPRDRSGPGKAGFKLFLPGQIVPAYGYPEEEVSEC